MPITLTKKKAVSKSKPKVDTQSVVNPEDLSDSQLADAYGKLQDEVAAIMARAEFGKLAEVQKVLNSRLEQADPESVVILKGSQWVVEAGMAAKNPRSLKDGAVTEVRRLVGNQAFAKIAKVNITDVEKYLTPEQCETVIESDTGYSKRRKVVCKFVG